MAMVTSFLIDYGRNKMWEIGVGLLNNRPTLKVTGFRKLMVLRQIGRIRLS